LKRKTIISDAKKIAASNMEIMDKIVEDF